MIPVIYGWGKNLKEIAYAGIEECSACKNYSHFSICEHSSNATLYFIKVARWNKKLVYVCKTCNQGWQLDDAKREDILWKTISLPSRDMCAAIWDRFMRHASETHEREKANGKQAIAIAVTASVRATTDALKQAYQEDHVNYVAYRFCAYLGFSGFGAQTLAASAASTH
jgi:hypothetical protein